MFRTAMSPSINIALIMHQQAVAGNKIGVIVPDAEIVDLLGIFFFSGQLE